MLRLLTHQAQCLHIDIQVSANSDFIFISSSIISQDILPHQETYLTKRNPANTHLIFQSPKRCRITPGSTSSRSDSMALSTTHPPSQKIFTLPAEIRVRMYRFLFGSATTVRIPEQQMLPSANSAALRFKGSMANRRNQADREHRDFVLEATRFLRSDSDFVKDDKNPDRSVTAIFQVCHQMHEETCPEFYREAQGMCSPAKYFLIGSIF